MRGGGARHMCGGYSAQWAYTVPCILCTVYYYLRPAEDSQIVCGGIRVHPKTANYGLVVEYMDRAQGPTMECFTPNLRVTLA